MGIEIGASMSPSQACIMLLLYGCKELAARSSNELRDGALSNCQAGIEKAALHQNQIAMSVF